MNNPGLSLANEVPNFLRLTLRTAPVDVVNPFKLDTPNNDFVAAIMIADTNRTLTFGIYFLFGSSV